MKKIILLFLTLSIINPALAEDKKLSYKASGKLVKKENVEAENNIIISPKVAASINFADIIEGLLPTVVNISALQQNDSGNQGTIDQTLLAELPKSPIFNDLKKQLESQVPGGNKKKIFSIGSGFLISKDGLVVTNHHVIDEASEINISTNDGTKYKAKIIGIDEKTDLALLKISSDKEFKFAKFGDSNKSRIGDWVIVVGNPYGLGGSVSIGIVSARSRNINNVQSEELIQTDAAINKGNSGGPMFNINGEVIGISSAIFSPSGGNVGIGFATPSVSAAKIIKQLQEKGEVTRGWIGISVQEVSDEISEAMKLGNNKGAFVNDVTKDGPADKSGIAPGDIILKFAGREIDEMKTLPKTVSNYPVNEIAKVAVWRNGKEKILKVKVEKLQEEKDKNADRISEKQQSIKPAGQALGLSLSELKSRVKKGKKEINIDGLMVTDIDIKSEAAKKGIMVGDIIISANQEEVSAIDDLKDAAERAKKDNKKLLLFIKRGDTNHSVILKIE